MKYITQKKKREAFFSNSSNLDIHVDTDNDAFRDHCQGSLQGQGLRLERFGDFDAVLPGINPLNQRAE